MEFAEGISLTAVQTSMSGTIAEIDLPPEEFALSRTISGIDDLEFEIERFVAQDMEHVMPYVWVTNDNREEIESALIEDPSLDEFRLIADLDDEWLYQMNWIDQIDTLVQILVEEEGSILAASGDASGWRLRVLFPERNSLSRTYEYCHESDLTIDIRSVYQLDEGREGRFGLTEGQQDTLETAFERGYFDVPRAITLTDLAAELDISHQALSERLRRGEKSVLKNTVIIGGDTDQE